MSGIYGLWNLDDQPASEHTGFRLRDALRHRGGDREGTWIDGPVLLGCQLLSINSESKAELQPFGNDVVRLVFDGRLDNRDDLLEELGGAPDLNADSPDAAFLMAAYRRHGTSFVARLKGDFALGLFDIQRRQLIIGRDVIGIKPLYYSRFGNTFLFASEIKAILAHPQVSAKPDEAKLARFLADGCSGPPDGATFFNGISSLPPAHFATLDRSGFSVSRYWEFDANPVVAGRTFDEYVDEFRNHFRTAVLRRLRSAKPVGVFVSGGLDSSSVFAVADREGRVEEAHSPVIGIALTSGNGLTSEEPEELTFLSDLERESGARMDRRRFNSPDFLTACRRAVWNVEAPLLDTHWPRQHDAFRFMAAARDAGATVVLTGDWSEIVLGGQGYLVDLVRHWRLPTVRRHLMEYPRWMHESVPNEFGRRLVFDLLRYSLPESLLQWRRALRRRRLITGSSTIGQIAGSLGTPLPSKSGGSRKTRSSSVHATVLRNRLIAGPTALFLEAVNKIGSAHQLELGFPFLDSDLLTFLANTPGEIQTQGGVPRALLRESMRGVLPESLRRRTWKTAQPAYRSDVMISDPREFDGLFGSGSAIVAVGYATREAMVRERGSARESIRQFGTVSWESQRLIALELWLQAFIVSPLKSPASPRDSHPSGFVSVS